MSFSFAEFFRAVHGFEPFQWQREAADFAVSHACLPQLIDVPTGLGKTALVDVWIWALAHHSERGEPHRLGQRYIHAVERRTVVDGADIHMQRLVAALTAESPTHPAVAQVVESLSKLSGDEMDVVAAHTFHGTLRDDQAWLKRPRGATIITTTATQLALRVLGHAPGITHSSAILHAGLTGYDVSWVIDEPHLAEVILDTLRQCSEIGSNSHLTVLGATVPDRVKAAISPGKTIEFSASQETAAALTRVNAYRTAHVVEAPGAEHRTLCDLVVKNHTPESRTVVFCNTIATADQVTDKLSKDGRLSVRMVTSRVRAVDRNDDPTPQPGEVVVATQTLEAGVDFEVDVLITQAAAWPSLVQRMGRFNRYGTAGSPFAAIVIPAEGKAADKGSCAVYESDIMESVIKGLRLLPDSVADFSLGEVNSTRDRVIGDGNVWPSPVRTGDLDAEYVSLLMVAPAPEAAELWLKGLDQNDEIAPVTVAWRNVLDPEILKLVPPARAESLDLSVSLARGLVAGDWQGNLSDTEAGDDIKFSVTGDLTDRLQLTRIRRQGTWRTPENLDDIRPGDTLILHTSLGGYRPDRGVWRSADPVTDVHAAATRYHISEVTDPELSTREISAHLGRFVLLRRDSLVVSVEHAARSRWRNPSKNDPIVILSDHLKQSEKIALKNASAAANASKEQVAAVARSALLHDSGKSFHEFQAYVGALPGDPLLAKSAGRDALPREIAFSNPEGFDHARIAGAALRTLGEHPLVCHLVESHHGFRGTSAYLSLSNPDPWSLAWSEAMVRLADWEASEKPVAGLGIDFSLPTELRESIGTSATKQTSSSPSLRLTGFDPFNRAGAWYSVIGLLFAVNKATGLDLKLSFDHGGIATLHDADEDTLDAAIGWVNDNFQKGAKELVESDSLRGRIASAKFQRIADESFSLRAALDESHLNPLSEAAEIIASYLVTPMMPFNGKAWEVSGGWIHANGSCAKRILEAPLANLDMLFDPGIGWETGTSVSAPDHCLDRVSRDVPTLVRTAEYSLLSLGLIAVGRTLTQTGTLSVRNKVRFLPTPTTPTTLWELEVLTRTRRGPGLQVQEFVDGQASLVTTPTRV